MGEAAPTPATYRSGAPDLTGPLDAPPWKGLVLVVEDDFLLRSSIAGFLISSGYEVESAADGLDALIWLESTLRKPQLILLDIALPRMDGIRFLTLQRSIARVASIPVIAITGDGKRRSNLAALGFRDAFFKPLDLPKLLQAIRAL
jgi:DNA-binding response OmpR family regulator